MFEHRKQPLLTPHEFLLRQLVYILVAFIIIIGSLALGCIWISFSRRSSLGGCFGQRLYASWWDGTSE